MKTSRVAAENLPIHGYNTGVENIYRGEFCSSSSPNWYCLIWLEVRNRLGVIFTLIKGILSHLFGKGTKGSDQEDALWFWVAIGKELVHVSREKYRKLGQNLSTPASTLVCKQSYQGVWEHRVGVYRQPAP